MTITNVRPGTRFKVFSRGVTSTELSASLSINVRDTINDATNKSAIPDDARLVYTDSEDSYAVKRLTWSQVKSAVFTALGSLIAGGTSKTTPVDADDLVLADSAASDATKRLSWANLKATLFASLGELIDAATNKVTPVDNDDFVIGDSEAAEETKRVSWANIKATLFASLGALTAAATSKATPVDADDLILADSAASEATKRLSWANLKATLFASLGTLTAAATSKSTPVDADDLILADSAASEATKRLSWADLKATLFAALGPLIDAASIKGTPVDNDDFVIADSEDSDETKRVSWAGIKATLKTYFDTLYKVPIDMLIGGARERPGEAKAAASETITGAASARDAFTAGTIVTSDYFGAVLQIDGSEIGSDGFIDVALRLDCPIEVGHKYAVRWALERAEDPVDPANEAIELRLQNLDKNKAAISNVVLGFNSGDHYELTEADGPLDVTMKIGREAADDIDYVVPATTRYVTVLVRIYGSTGKTNVAVLDCTDITLATQISSGDSSVVAADLAQEILDRIADVDAEEAARIAADLAKPNGAYLLTSVGGSTTAYTGTASPALAAYATGQRFWFLPNATNTGNATLNVSGLGAKSIRDWHGALLPAGALVADQPYELYYNGTHLLLTTDWRDANGAYILTSVGGTTTAYTGTASPVLGAYATGQRFWFIPNATNTGNATLNVSGLGAKSIRDRHGSLLPAGTLVADQPYQLYYNGTHLLLTSDWRDADGPIELTVGGTSTAYTATANVPLLAYAAGQVFSFTPNVTSGASPTLNVASLGARSIRDAAGATLAAGALVAGTRYLLTFDGTLMRVPNRLTSDFRWLTVSGGPTAYTATCDFVNFASAGQAFWFTPNVDADNQPTVNINSTGAKSIRDSRGNNLPAGYLTTGVTYALVWNGTVLKLLDDDQTGDFNYNVGAIVGTNMLWGWHEAEQRLYMGPIDLDLADAKNKAHRENVRSRGVQPDIASVIIGGVNIIAGIGQSKMVGAQGGPAIDRTPITGNFMLGGQERSITKNHVFTPYSGSGDAYLEPLIATVEDDDFFPMSEAEQDALTYGEDHAGQTSLTSATNGFRVLFDIATGGNDPDTWMVAVNLGIGGTTADELRKGHTQGSVEYYTQYTSALDQIKTIADAEGKSCQVLAILRSQGESDELGTGLSENGAEFEAVVDQDVTDREEDAVDHGGNALIHPALPDTYRNRVKPAYYTTIIGEGYARDEDPSGTPDSMTANAYQRIARARAGRYFVLGPDYPYTNIDNQHFDANGYRWRGLKWAQIMYRVQKLREGWEPCWVLATELKDDIAYIHCNVPVGKLQVGTPYEDGVAATSGLQAGGLNVYGFKVVDAGLTIGIEASIVSDTVIRLDLSRAPYSPEGIYYAPENYGGYGYICDEDEMDPLWDFQELAGMFNLPAELINERYDMRNYLCPGYFPFNQDFTA